MREALDFRQTRRRYSPLGITLLILGLASLAAVAQRWHVVSRETEGLHWSIAARTPPPDIPQTPSTQDKLENAARSTIQHELTFAWQPALAALEASTAPQVALLAIEVRPQRFTLSAQAKSLKEALDYVARLNHAPGLKDVLMRQYKVDDNDPAHPVRFELQGDIAP